MREVEDDDVVYALCSYVESSSALSIFQHTYMKDIYTSTLILLMRKMMENHHFFRIQPLKKRV